MVGEADETIQRIVSNNERPEPKRRAGRGAGRRMMGSHRRPVPWLEARREETQKLVPHRTTSTASLAIPSATRPNWRTRTRMLACNPPKSASSCACG